VSAAEAAVSVAEARALFRPLTHVPALVLAVSGGPDSTALLYLVARWRRARKDGPRIFAVTVDHGLRPQSATEARAVGRLARQLGVVHRILRWEGSKPVTGVQQAAREARYRLLAAAATRLNARHVLTAHTLDDQAETVLMRLVRGSGLSGLAAMAAVAPLPASDARELVLVRPLLELPKARLLATLARAGIPYADDPTNRDPRFTRARLRAALPELAREGLDAARLATLARRARRAEVAIEAAVDAAAAAVMKAGPPAVVLDAEKLAPLPAEVALRLLARAISQVGGSPPLGKLEALHAALVEADFGRGRRRLRRTLADTLVTAAAGAITVERAPPRIRRS
jgi:tRNA(Ile)-lysidine synthase